VATEKIHQYHEMLEVPDPASYYKIAETPHGASIEDVALFIFSLFADRLKKAKRRRTKMRCLLSQPIDRLGWNGFHGLEKDKSASRRWVSAEDIRVISAWSDFPPIFP
jgi:hypothetical protein